MCIIGQTNRQRPDGGDLATYRVSATVAVRQFSELVRRVGDGGQEVVIERHRKPVVRISQVGFSPVRWADFCRQVRRTRQPDPGFVRDLLKWRAASAAKSVQTAPFPLTPGTVLLDSTLLLGAFTNSHALERAQRVSTTAAAVAELAHIAGARGPYIAELRMLFLRRIAAALPVISLTQEASLLPGTGGRASVREQGLFFGLAEATARSVAWPIVGAHGLMTGPQPGTTPPRQADAPSGQNKEPPGITRAAPERSLSSEVGLVLRHRRLGSRVLLLGDVGDQALGGEQHGGD
ncbi:MAG: hypothetical protein NVS3B24_19090 [Candidatus Dormibacteria bacterium]